VVRARGSLIHLNTYVHLLDEFVGDAEFMDEVFMASPEVGPVEKRGPLSPR
jgi:hypothetical protein